MADQLPRAGSGTEVYLFPTVDVAPTAANSQYGPEPDDPEPDPNNRTTDRIGVAGSLRDASAALLPVTVSIEGIANLQSQVNQQNALTLGQLLAPSLASLDTPGVGTAVPWFGVKFAGDSAPRRLDPDFNSDAANFPALQPPAGYDLVRTATYAPAAALCLDDDGAVLCAYLIEQLVGPDLHQDRLRTVQSGD